MIIGLSGKKGTGKDLIGQMIQHLTEYKEGDCSFEEYQSMCSSDGILFHRYETMKFADTLKDMVCMLIGCSREELESEEFKATPLGKEWERTVFHISSKDNKALETFDTYEQAVTFSAHWEEYYDQIVFVEEEEVIMTPRLLLQLLGTECGRRILHPNIWVNALMSQYTKETRKFGEYVDGGPMMIKKYPDWVITDCRFPNEKEAIEKKDGFVIRVNRITGDDSLHASEVSLDDAKFKYVIDNNGSIEELYKEVKAILTLEGII